MKLIWLTILTLFFANISFAQEVVVKNISTEEVLESVAIFNQRMDRSTITDLDGVASLKNFSESDTLYFQHPSYDRLAVPYAQAVAQGTIHLERKNILIPEFVITASKHLENKREVPYLIDVISPQSIEYTPIQNSADLLASSGNVFVQKSQAGGGSPVLRGFEANRVLLVIDGVRMNNAIYRSGHLQNSLTIDNAVLERVEVIYGPSSVIYGSDALGGVIHYITKSPEFGDSLQSFNFSGQAYFQGASASKSTKSHLDLNFGFKKVAFLTSLTYSNYGDILIGYRRNPFYGDWGKQIDYVERINGEDVLVENPNPNRLKGTGFEQFDMLQKIKYQANQHLNFDFNFQFSTSSNINRQDQLNNRDNGIPEFSAWYYGPQERVLALTKLSHDKPNNFYNSMEATLAFQNIEESRYTREYRIDTLYQQVEGVQIGSLNLDLFKELSPRNSISYGIELNSNRISSIAHKTNIIDNYTDIDITRYPDNGTTTMASGAYVSYKSRLHPKLLSSIGLRFQHYILNASYGEFYSDLPDVFRDIKIENQAITSSLSFIFNQTRSFNWNLIFSTGFRSPNLDDLAKIRLTSGKLTLPNEQLVPEYTYNGEIGLSKTFDGYIRINGNYFFTYLTNAITREEFFFEDGSDTILFQGRYRKTYQNTNSTEAYIHGLSLNLVSDFNTDISFKSTLNYTFGKNLTDQKPMAHIPPIYGRTEFSYEIRRFVFEAYFIYAGWKHIDDMVDTGEDKEDEATIHGFPGWYTLNMNSIFNINKHIIFQLAIENLTDNYYKPFASGVPAPGINIVSTLRVKF
jgi:hemoglobin/transferrin/lactoferrin receptor protein